MYGDFFLIEQPGHPVRRAPKLSIGDTRGRNEAWLRDTLFAHPELLPISAIDASFGPLLPLCRELRTEAGPLDLAFINSAGRLTLVECKLWRNPEARRKVVAQVLDYARAIARWSYSDLQRQVSAATGRKGNVPFAVAQAAAPDLVEHHFIDAMTQTMRSGRFLLLIAGDGVREDVGALAELINRNAALGFSLGLVEVALYQFGEDGGIAIQPRAVAKTQVIERSVVLLKGGDRDEFLGVANEDGEAVAPSREGALEPSRPRAAGPAGEERGGESAQQAEYRRWWQPVLDMTFDDPDQPSLKLYFPNNVRAQLPWPGTWVTAYRAARTSGVSLSGREGPLAEAWERLAPDAEAILAELPEGTNLGSISPNVHGGFTTARANGTFENDEARREWLRLTLNAYVNALRPRLRWATS